MTTTEVALPAAPIQAPACGVQGGCQAGGIFPGNVTIQEAGPDDPYEWRVVDHPVVWRGIFGDHPVRVVVPVDFLTDLASVPRWLTWLVPRYGEYTRAAVIHDCLCQNIATFSSHDAGDA